MPTTINVPPFLSGIVTPEQKHDPIAFTIHRFDHTISKRLPTFALMGACLALHDCEHAVQQQYALFCPWLQTAVIRRNNAQITLDFLKNVNKWGRRRNVWPY